MRAPEPDPRWRPLGGDGAVAADVGGKAAALDRLAGAGVPIPRTAVVTVSAYRDFVGHAGLEAFLAELPGRVPPARLEADAGRVEAAFVAAPIPDPIRRAIAAATAFAGAGGPLAVRSSATAEDMDDASFAGQYRSFLDVGPDDVELAVRRCWASLWGPGARAYRAARGLAGGDLAMAVVIQAMVPADQSGVVFTVDPTGGAADQLRVEVVDGLGERLVSGEATPAVFHLSRTQPGAVAAGAPPYLPALAARAMLIEAAFGGPQDIEWSVAGGRLFILQARPITTGAAGTGDGFDTPALTGAVFTPAGVHEVLPGTLAPLIWTINGPMLEDAFAALYDGLGITPPGPPQPMLGRFRGRAALNLTRLKAAAGQMPGGSGAEVERQYLGRVFDDGESDDPGPRWGRLRAAGRALALRRRLPTEAAVFLDAADLVLAMHTDPGEVATGALVAYRRRLRDLARAGVRTEVAVAAAAAANYRGLELALERWLGAAEAPLAAQRLTTGRVADEAGGCAAALALWDLHCDYCELPQVARAVYEGPIADTEARLAAAGPAGRAFLERVDEALRRAGSAAVYAGIGWDEERPAFWSVLRQCRGLDRTGGLPSPQQREADGAAYLEELEHRLRRNWRWRVTRLFTGQLVDVRRRLLRRMVSDAATFLRLRETLKSALLRLGGEERRVIAELAHRLRTAGALERPDDELLLADDELDRLAAGDGGPDRATIGHRRRAFDAYADGSPLPERFSGFPAADTPADTTDPDGDVLSGWATSPGRVVGRARVVRGLADASDLAAGEILVGRSTDPSWTPLFLTAAAIVMEQGGPLSHAAIVAREFGLPAVLNVKGATRRIRTGMAIAVDGTRGTVEILEEAEVQAA